jgi:hypothetical protein
MAKLYKTSNWTEGMADVHFTCPGCNCDHGVWVNPHNNGGAKWDFNGDFNKPTFSPSILVRWVGLPNELEKDENGNHILGNDGRVKGAKDMICHSFVKDGMIQFLADCTHELKGQTVELSEIE